jgi:hypothetical protein
LKVSWLYSGREDSLYLIPNPAREYDRTAPSSVGESPSRTPLSVAPFFVGGPLLRPSGDTVPAAGYRTYILWDADRNGYRWLLTTLGFPAHATLGLIHAPKPFSVCSRGVVSFGEWREVAAVGLTVRTRLPSAQAGPLFVWSK